MKSLIPLLAIVLLTSCATPPRWTEGPVRITVQGAVAKPGVYGFAEDETCTVAGLMVKMGPGFIVIEPDGPTTDVELITIVRRGNDGESRTFRVHLRYLKEQYPLKDGDIVIFSTRGLVM